MMTFYYSMKQMLRTPLRSILFFVLVGISALLLAVGGSLLYQSSGMEREFEKIYTTIATVEQKQEEVRTIPVWDETLQDYYYINHGVYGDRIPDEVLDFDGKAFVGKFDGVPGVSGIGGGVQHGIGSVEPRAEGDDPVLLVGHGHVFERAAGHGERQLLRGPCLPAVV